MPPEKAAMLAKQTLIGAAQLRPRTSALRSSGGHHLQEGYDRGRDKGHDGAGPARGRQGRLQGQQEKVKRELAAGNCPPRALCASRRQGSGRPDPP